MGRRTYDEDMPALLEKYRALASREFDASKYRNPESIHSSELLEIVRTLKIWAAEGRQIEIRAFLNKPAVTAEDKVILAEEHKKLEDEIILWSAKP